MNPGGHIGAGWVLGHTVQLDRFERRWIVVMALLSDADGVFMFWSRALDEWHRTFGHNVWVWLGAPLVVPLFAARGRRFLLLGLSYLAMASHVALDLVGTGWWALYPLWPLRGPEILMSNYLAENTMKWMIQPALLIVFVTAMVWIYIRHKRTPLEVISPCVDSLLTNFVLLPWRHRCGECSGLAFYRCSQCGRPLCPSHRTVNWRLEVCCRPRCPTS